MSPSEDRESSDVIDVLRSDSDTSGSFTLQFESGIQKFLFWASVVLFIITVLTAFIGNTGGYSFELAALIFALFSQIFAVLYLMTHTWTAGKFLLNPDEEFFDSLEKNIQREQELISDLKKN